MLRPTAHTGVKASATGGFAGTLDISGKSSYPSNGESKYAKKRPISKTNLILLGVAFVIFGVMTQRKLTDQTGSNSNSMRKGSSTTKITSDMAVFDKIKKRAQEHQSHCHSLGLIEAEDFSNLNHNNHTAHLPQSGIIHAIDSYKHDTSKYPYQ